MGAKPRLGRAIAAAALLLWAPCGCFDAPDPDVLGQFDVTGTLAHGCASQGPLAAPDSLDFELVLRRVENTLHWQQAGEVLTGTIEDDGSFLVEYYVNVDMRAETPHDALPPCQIDRFDEKVGSLDTPLSGKASSLTGELRYQYQASTMLGIDCSDLTVGEERMIDELPCTTVYEIQGERQQDD